MEMLKQFGEFIRSKGWEPLLAIVSEHGKCICCHIYAAVIGEDGSKDKFGLFRFSDDQNILPDEFTEFPSVDEGNMDYARKRVFVRKNRHVVIDMTEFMEVA